MKFIHGVYGKVLDFTIVPHGIGVIVAKPPYIKIDNEWLKCVIRIKVNNEWRLGSLKVKVSGNWL